MHESNCSMRRHCHGEKESAVIEVKVAKTADELEEKADEAIRQIHDKDYDAKLYADSYKTVVNFKT